MDLIKSNERIKERKIPEVETKRMKRFQSESEFTIIKSGLQ